MNSTSSETNTSLQAELQAFAACLRFCAVLLRYPDQAVYAALKGTLPHFGDLHLALLGQPHAALPPFDCLQQDYTSLFVANPGGLPAVPYVSCRLEPEGHTYGVITVELRKLMAQEGVKADSGQGEPEDHVGVVFDFAALLAERSAEDYGKLPVAQQVIHTYLLPVLPGFAADVATAQPAGFYAEAAAFCSTLVGNYTALFPSITTRETY